MRRQVTRIRERAIGAAAAVTVIALAIAGCGGGSGGNVQPTGLDGVYSGTFTAESGSQRSTQTGNIQLTVTNGRDVSGPLTNIMLNETGQMQATLDSSSNVTGTIDYGSGSTAMDSNITGQLSLDSATGVLTGTLTQTVTTAPTASYFVTLSLTKAAIQ